ncbi:hypothetical protein VNI00_013989 [Paramarasmius palmivorus]|uniref:F-box domain-containing protein n=1 Tax=Paramarasmius palmivorus TaxID=297713 RepID=A0AAW0BXF3_9AGAR
MHSNGPNTPTLFIPIESPPTPAPSPSPSLSLVASKSLANTTNAKARLSIIDTFLSLCTPSELHYINDSIDALLKRDFLRDLPVELSLRILEFVAHDKPQDLCQVAAVSRWWNGLVMGDLGESLWRGMCIEWGWGIDAFGYEASYSRKGKGKEPLQEMERYANLPMDPALEWLADRKRKGRTESMSEQDSDERRPSWRERFRYFYSIRNNYLSHNGGNLLRTHRISLSSSSSAADSVVTSLALNNDWVVVGLANNRIHVFSAKTGVLSRTLVGHQGGVWGIGLVSASEQKKPSKESTPPGSSSSSRPSPKSRHSEYTRKGNQQREFIDPLDSAESHPTSSHSPYVPPSIKVALGLSDEEEDPEADTDIEPGPWIPSEPSNTSRGFGQPNALVVSGACDRCVKVWDVASGFCIYTLYGHTSTVRCLRVLHEAPIAVTGSRDTMLKVWDIKHGRLLHTLAGHADSIRSLDVVSRCKGKQWEAVAASGSYDRTVRIWSLSPAGATCKKVLTGHFSQVYSVVISVEKDGKMKVISGALDTSVRVWDVNGDCLALLQGHSALVCHLQVISPLPGHEDEETIVASASSTGTVILYSLLTYLPLPNMKLVAHEGSVTSIQVDRWRRWMITAGNDGHVLVWDLKDGSSREFGGAGSSGRDAYDTETAQPTSTSTGRTGGSRRSRRNSKNVGAECIWKVGFSEGGEVCALMMKKDGKTVMEFWDMRGR